MFGEDYFKARESLASLASRVVELADKTESNKAPLVSEDITQGLISPYLFVVCGESNSGKSTLLNGIFGQELCGNDPSAQPSKIQWFRHGEKSLDKEITPLIEECYRPIPFLKQFNLMDTPGTNSGSKAHQPVTQKFLPSADLIFWVIPVGNPWGASLWDFVSQQNESILKKSVIVLQQAELQDENDLKIILGHVQDLAVQRLSYVPPLFPVSSKQASEAKLAHSVNAALWQDSGYPALEQHIAETVEQSPARQRMLVDIRKAIVDVLRSIEQTVEQRAEQLEGNESFLRELEAEVSHERNRHTAEFAVNFTGMREVFAGKNKEAKCYVRKKLGFFSTLKSLFVAENTSKVIESWLIESVESSVSEQADMDGNRVVDDCHQHWQTVMPRVKKKLAIELPDFDDSEDGFDSIREGFGERLTSSAHQALLNLRIRKGLNPHIVRRREQLKNWLYLCLVFLLASGVAGALDLGSHYYVAYGLFAVSSTFLLIFAVRVRLTAKHLAKSLSARLENGRMSFSRALEQDYKEGVRSFYTEYGSLLSSVRQHIFKAQQELQPNLEQRNRLFLELMIIEQDL